MKRYDIINHFIAKKGYSSYLEIGLCKGETFTKINAENKTSVDPAENEYAHAKPTHKMTSDEFFEQNEDTFDIIFIDGLHHADQVYKDIQNSLDVLNPGGTVICHDMNPQKKEQQIVPRQQKTWTGDCWKALVEFRCENRPYQVRVVDTDWGVAVIQESDENDNLEVKEELSFENFQRNRKRWLNLISINEFKEFYK